MKNKKEVLIIIPAYNEAKTIVTLLDQLEDPEIASIADVLVMNDASSDATNWVAKARKHTVVTHVFNLGYGSGLQLGYKYAIRKGYHYVIQMDADGQHDVKNVLHLYKELQKKRRKRKFPGYCFRITIYGRKCIVLSLSSEKSSICIISQNDLDWNGKENHGSYNGITGIELENSAFLFKIQ